MTQKISSLYYIKNNKRRVSVLVVSLAMLFIITYLAMFILSTTSVTFESILTDTTKYIQYISLGSGDLDIAYEDEDNPDTSYVNLYMEAIQKKCNEMAEALKQYDGIEDIWIADVGYSNIYSVVGQYSIHIPTGTKEQMNMLLAHMGAKLIKGRLPENENEVVLDSKSVKNGKYSLGDGRNLKIVGIIECDYYFGCGLAGEQRDYDNPMICVITDGTVRNLREIVEQQGFELKDSRIYDVVEGEEEAKTEVIDVIDSSTNLLFVGILVIVSILVIIVNISYMRDRRSEWCLYASIGYGRKAIYYSILRELLFVFVFALIGAAAICLVSMKIIDVVMVTGLGLKCDYFMPDTLIEVLCAYIMLFGLMQIPMRIAMYKIKTIDAIDDDM